MKYSYLICSLLIPLASHAAWQDNPGDAINHTSEVQFETWSWKLISKAPALTIKPRGNTVLVNDSNALLGTLTASVTANDGLPNSLCMNPSEWVLTNSSSDTINHTFKITTPDGDSILSSATENCITTGSSDGSYDFNVRTDTTGLVPDTYSLSGGMTLYYK